MGEADAREPVEVRVLGPFGLSVGGRPVALPSGRLRVLLAVLAMSAGRAVPVDRLVDGLWGEDLPDNARRTIHTYVTRLRAILGADAITTEPAGYVLHTVPDNIDALRFLRLLDRPVGEPQVERALLSEALELWRGRPFEDLDSELLRTETARLDERRLTALVRRIDLDLVEGRASEVVGELRELVSTYPLREPLWARLLVALARSGRSAEALEQYEAVRSRIADELGVDPGPELQRIYADLLAGVTPEPAGQAQPAQPRPVVPRQLPADIASFTGRARTLAALDAIFDSLTAQEQPLIVALHGTGGVGKTTLAVHWAHRVADRFPDGQFYLNLHGYGPGTPVTPATALNTLLRGLGVAGEQIPTEVEARASLLRSLLAERRMLLLLDNARNAEQARPLLPGTGDCLALVTSRSQLRGLVAREGAARIEVDHLDPAESTRLLSGILASHGASHHDAELAELAERCGHLPLALAIAAERAGRHPEAGLTELVDELREEQVRLDALDLSEDAATDLRAVFTWSYQALDADTARMFRLLGLHSGPDISRPAAAALADTTTAKSRRLLDHLVDANLLQQRRARRYELHDLLHDYAAELAQQVDPPADRDVALSRFVDWYIHSASNARNTLGTTRGTPRPLSGVRPHDPGITPQTFESRHDALAWFEAEFHTLDPLVRVAAARDQHRQTYQLVHTWRNYLLDDRRALYELLNLLDLAADAADRTVDDTARAQVSNLRGRTRYELMHYDAAIGYFERAHSLFEDADDRLGLCLVLCNLGMAHNALGRLEDAASFYERALAVRVDPNDDVQRPTTLNNLAMTYIDMGRHKQAAETSRQAVELAHQREQHRSEGSALDTLGQALHALGHVDQAIDHFRRSRDLLVQTSCPRWNVGSVLVNLGRSLRDAGRPEEARTAWKEALDILDELDAPDGREFGRTMVLDLLASLPAHR